MTLTCRHRLVFSPVAAANRGATPSHQQRTCNDLTSVCGRQALRELAVRWYHNWHLAPRLVWLCSLQLPHSTAHMY